MSRTQLLLSLSFSWIVLVMSCNKNRIAPNRNSSGIGNSEMEKTPLRILTYNTFLLPSLPIVSSSQWAQQERALALGNADFIKHYDVLLLQECFDNAAAESLREALLPAYPYQTPVLGRTKEGWDETKGNWREVGSGGFSNGGVMIASRYPIEKKAQFIYPAGCNFDAACLKGFVYACILKNGKRTHIFATHTQSTQSSCGGAEVQIREYQLKAMKAYADSLHLPSNEIVVYGGDFNIIKGSPEYNNMLKTLNVSEPDFRGAPYTWDTKNNTLAAYDYPYPDYNREYIDYIFIANDHQNFPHWQNSVLTPVSRQWMSSRNLLQETYYWFDYSDHYPVAGSIFNDEAADLKETKFRKYDRISLQSVATGKYITMNLQKSDDWLRVSAAVPDESTWFNIVNIGGQKDNYFSLTEGRVRVECSERINNFWYWELLNGGAWYYFPKFGKSLTGLELVLVKKKQGNISVEIEDGDIVAFRDYTQTGNSYYLQVYNSGGEDWIYLNGDSTGPSEQFIVRLNNK